MTKLPKTKFFSKASYLLSRGADKEAIYQLEKECEITKEEIDQYFERQTKSKAISGALTASKEEKDYLFQILDQKFLETYQNLVAVYRGENISFYEYSKGVYRELLEHDMYNKIDDLMMSFNLLDYRTSQRSVKDTIKRISALFARTKGRIFFEEQIQKQKWYLNLANGLLDLNDFSLSPHTPNYFSTVQVPYSYDPEAEAPMFNDFVKVVSNNSESTARMIQEMFGYCISEGNPNHKVFYLYGDTARNGKSTTAKIICGLIGWGNVSTLSLSQLAGENSSILTSLVGKQINFSDEISSKYIESSRLTAMSAEGLVEINPKYKHSYLHQVRTKFIITCNDLPQFQDAQGMKHRMVSVPFRHHFKESERILRYDQILLEKEGSGILNWAIEGAKILKANTGFSTNEESQEDVHENMLQNNSVYAYMYGRYDFNEKFEEEVEMEDLYGQRERGKEEDATGYRLFCLDTGVHAKSFQVFCRELKRFARETGKIIQKKRESGGRYYIGLKLKKPVLTQPDFGDFN